MTPIPGRRGHSYAITSATAAGVPLVVAFNRHPKGPLDQRLVKDAKVRKLPEDEQALARWYLRYKTRAGSPTWKMVGAARDILPALEVALTVLGHTSSSATPAHDALVEQMKERKSLTIGTLLDRFIAAGCPDRRGRPRTGKRLTDYARLIEMAGRWWGPRAAATTTAADVHDFAAWRRDQTLARCTAGDRRISGDGTRTAELEIDAIAQVLRYAVRNRWLPANPLAERDPIERLRDVDHAWQWQPATDEELHRLATHLLRDPRTAVSGARMLFAALTGLRCGEHALRWDAPAGIPGHRFSVQLDENRPPEDRLLVHREKSGINPAVPITAPLAEFLAAWRPYVAARWGSAWMFPHPTEADCGQHKNQMGRDLNAAAAALGLPRRTAHGLRAFCVTALRSAGHTDSAIADRLGQRSGADIVRLSYGAPDTVFGSRTHDWMPSVESGVAPAWSLLPAMTAELAAGQASVDAVDFGAVQSAVTTAVTNLVPKVALGGSFEQSPSAALERNQPAQRVG